MKRMFGLFLLLCASLSAAQQLTIQITKGVDNPLKIAIVPFEWAGFGTLPENIPAIVSNDLYTSGEFAPIAEKNMLSLPHQEKEVVYRDWRYLGAEYLVVGRINRSANSNQVQVTYELFNVTQQMRVYGEVISGTDAQLRDIAHQISDVVFEKILNIKGAFSTKILYITSQRKSATLTQYQLNLSDADGARPQVLLESREPIMSPTWSPDGKQIAYVSFESSRSRIYIQNLSTGAREQLTNFPDSNGSPDWSPDGTKMAMVLSKDGSPDIYVMDLKTRALRKITTNSATETEPSWTPDGKSLIYTSDQSGTFRPQIYQVNLETGFSERLTFDGTFNANATMLPDGKSMILIHRGEVRDDFNMAIMNLERGTIRTLTDTSLDESATLAPNAHMVMYASKVGEKGVLNVVSINGRVKYQLPAKDGDVRDPAWSPFMP